MSTLELRQPTETLVTQGQRKKNEQIASLKHRFCPYCGTSYQTPEL